MVGIVLGLLWGAYRYIFSDYSGEMAYLSATGFMYSWSLFWTIVLGIILAIIGLVVTLFGGISGLAVGSERGWGFAGTIIGIVLGGNASVLLAVLFFFRSALYVTGFHLLNTALTGSESEWVWNQTNLILGGLLILVAIFTRSKSSSSSKKDD